MTPATATTTSTSPPKDKPVDSKEESKVSDKEVAKATEELEKSNPRVLLGPAKIQTAEDATVAYLRDEIDEATYRAILGRYGILPGQLMGNNVEPFDSAFDKDIPKDIKESQRDPVSDLEARQKAVDEKSKTRVEEIKASIKSLKEEEDRDVAATIKALEEDLKRETYGRK